MCIPELFPSIGVAVSLVLDHWVSLFRTLFSIATYAVAHPFHVFTIRSMIMRSVVAIIAPVARISHHSFGTSLYAFSEWPSRRLCKWRHGSYCDFRLSVIWQPLFTPDRICVCPVRKFLAMSWDCIDASETRHGIRRILGT